MNIFKIIGLISEGQKKVAKIREDGQITVEEVIELVRWAFIKLEINDVVLIKEDGKRESLVLVRP